MWQQPAPSPFAAASPREFGSGAAAATLGSSASWAGAVGSQAQPAPQFGSFGAPVSSGMSPAGGTTWNGGSQWSGARAPRPGELPGEGENGCGGSPAIGCGGSGSDASWRPLGLGAGASSSSSAVSPWVLGVPEGPERPRMRRHPPFTWQPATDFLGEFRVSGDAREVVTKVGDFWEPGTVVPAAGTLQMSKGGLYHWTLLLETVHRGNHVTLGRSDCHLSGPRSSSGFTGSATAGPCGFSRARGARGHGTTTPGSRGRLGIEHWRRATTCTSRWTCEGCTCPSAHSPSR
mmetsp:Transcript_150916/g.484996  ORF Transcript_150916/g.484996 Transcript_150916/m.484996 type:complete len:290 (+) Transcript_150916:112-981(+)